jgi:two-component system response regulator VicR
MKILICESEEVLLTAIEFRLRKNGYDIAWAKTSQEALGKINEEQPDLFIIDIETDTGDSLEMIKEVRAVHKDKLPILIMAEMESVENILEAIEEGVNDFLIKPFKPVELVLRAQIILDRMED